jgi:5-methylcytosine-specific restriction enzyme subunit McrC
MSKANVHLTEYESSDVLSYDLLEDEERFYLKTISTYKNNWGNDKHRFYLIESRKGFSIRATSWVGVLERSKMRIEIKPKFDRGFARLVDMLCFLHNIPFHDTLDTLGEWGDSEFVELLAQMFLTELTKTLRGGVVKEYITIEDNLNQLRGRPDFIKNNRLNYANPTRMYCHFDELVTDIPENQVLSSALEVLLRLPLFQATQKRVRHCLGELEEICESYIAGDWPNFQYNRLNEHYKTVHHLAQYIIQHTFLQDMYHAKEQSYFCLLMDMNELFEKFAAKLLQIYLPKLKYKVQAGEKFESAIRKEKRLYRWIVPDIVVTNRYDNVQLVLDVKYKNYGNNKIINEDIYQLAFYGHSFHKDLTKLCYVHLIYPRYANVAAQEDIIALNIDTPHEMTLRTKPLCVELCLDLIKAKQIQAVTDIALYLIS